MKTLMAVLLIACTPVQALDDDALRRTAVARFARLDWTGKVNVMRELKAAYRKPCRPLAGGMVHACIHTMTSNLPDGAVITLRADAAGSWRQWCMGNYDLRERICINQDTGERLKFIIHDDRWVAVHE